MVKDESHIQTNGVQTPDTERVSGQSGQGKGNRGSKSQTRKECLLIQGKEKGVRGTGHGKSVGSIRAKGGDKEKRETWVSRHYDLRTELGGGRPK